MVYISPSSAFPSTPGPIASPSDLSNKGLDAEWKTILASVKSAPADQREQLEDEQLLNDYSNGGISANDLNKLLTKAADTNKQVDPGKEAVKRAEAWAEAHGQKLTDQQKNSIAQAARQQAAQQKLALVQKLLTSEYSNQPPGAHQAVAIGFSVFDANGHKQNVLARIDGQGNFGLQKISDLGDGYGDQVLIDNAIDHLRSEQAANPDKSVSEEVHGPGGKFKVTLAADGKVTVKQEHGFWGGLLHFLESTVAPIALAAIPGIGGFAAAAYLGVKGGYDIANGNVLGGLGEIFGGVAGVGGAIGGAMGGALQDGAQLANIGLKIDASVESGNPLGALAAAAGATVPLGDLASTLGTDGLASAISDWAPGVVTAANIGANIASGNIAGAITMGANVAPIVADQLGASDGLVDTIGTWTSDAATAAKVGLLLANGNYLAAAGIGADLGQLDALNWLQEAARPFCPRRFGLQG
jgi:hypothetical protein